MIATAAVGFFVGSGESIDWVAGLLMTLGMIGVVGGSGLYEMDGFENVQECGDVVLVVPGRTDIDQVVIVPVDVRPPRHHLDLPAPLGHRRKADVGISHEVADVVHRQVSAAPAHFFTLLASIGSRRSLQVLCEVCELPIVDPPEQRERQDRADECQEHVRLRVPGIALGAQERVGRLVQPPLL